MISVTHPLLAGFRATFAAGSAGEADVSTCVDQLQDLGATLADVLLLFAGGPPEWLAQTWHEDKGWWAMLAKWCEVTEPKQRKLVDIRFLDVGPAPRKSPEKPADFLKFRFEAVGACAFDWTAFRESLYPAEECLNPDGTELFLRDKIEASDWGILPRRVLEALARARRKQKRQVLALFPDICKNGPPQTTPNGIEYFHRIFAPDWIPPEPPSRGTRADVMEPIPTAPLAGFLFTPPPSE